MTKKIKQDILNNIKNAGKLFGKEVIISDNPKDKSYIKGFEAGKNFIRREMLRLFDLKP